MLCHSAHYSLFSKVNTLFCSTGHALLFQVCSMKQKNFLMKCAPGHTFSMLKPISFVVKWSVLSPLASKSYGVSQMTILAYRMLFENLERTLSQGSFVTQFAG